MPFLERLEIYSDALRGARRVWLGRSSQRNPTRCLIFLDAELYLERVGAEGILSQRVTYGEAPDLTRVYLSYGEPSDRHIDFICSDAFSSFLVEELPPWITERTQEHHEFILVGLSLSGLAAIYAAMKYPGVFTRIISQSPSAWWNDEWIAGQAVGLDLSGERIWLSVGNQETSENVSHSPNLFQKTSQLDSCRRLAEVLKSTARIQFEKFEGGHDPACWAIDLSNALEWHGR